MQVSISCPGLQTKRPAERAATLLAMATGREYTKHQRGIINRYYDNIDTITVQRLGEIVTDLYLAETDKKRDQLWKRAESALGKVTKGTDRPAVQARKVLAGRDVEGLAHIVASMDK